MYSFHCSFIRSDANEALDAFCEHVSVHRVIVSLQKLGLGHKNVVARTATGRLLANLSLQMGPDLICDEKQPYKETTDILLNSLATLMCDGSLDVRQEAKRAFSGLLVHSNFELVLRSSVPSQTIQKIRKQLDLLRSQLEKE